MSNYTTEVRFICENASGLNHSAGYSNIEKIISSAIPKVFDFQFPIFDENYRNVLCTKILKHYYTREICEETVGLWKLRLSTRLNEIMPYYNQLYKSELLQFNPLYDTDYTRDTNKKHDGVDNLTKNNTQNTDEDITNTATKSSDSKGEYTEAKSHTSSGENDNQSTTTSTSATTVAKSENDMYSDTPQGALTNLETGQYLTNARKKTGNESNNTNGSGGGTSNTTYTETNSDENSGSNKLVEAVNDSFNGKRKLNSTERGTDNRTINTTENYLEHVSGKTGSLSYSKMLMEFRETFVNIDVMVINSLSDLFFNLW